MALPSWHDEDVPDQLPGEGVQGPWSDPSPWTERRWLALGDTRPFVELFDGSVLVSPAPTPRHQRVSRRLANLLETGADRVGLEVYEAINLRLQPGRILIPDLAIVAPVDPDQPIVDAGACLLVCEIVSPSSPAIDRVLKMHYYAEAAIAWYLLVEPAPALTLRLFRHDGGRYVEHATAGPDEQLKLTEPVDVILDSAALDD